MLSFDWLVAISGKLLPRVGERENIERLCHDCRGVVILFSLAQDYACDCLEQLVHKKRHATVLQPRLNT